MSDAGGGVAYIDTSALLKLVVREAESEALDRERSTWRGLATSTITEIELRRAIGPLEPPAGRVSPPTRRSPFCSMSSPRSR